eukprot:5259-Amphidinium_carterae.1
MPGRSAGLGRSSLDYRRHGDRPFASAPTTCQARLGSNSPMNVYHIELHKVRGNDSRHVSVKAKFERTGAH